MSVVDLSSLADEEREREAARLAEQEAQRTFDLVHGPLLRVTLIRLADTVHHLVMTFHDSVFDTWSIGVFTRELETLYPSYVGAGSPEIPEPAIQYADFAIWQRELLQEPILEPQLAYWRQQLANLPLLALPTTYPRPAHQTFAGATQTVALSPSLFDAISTLSFQENSTLPMVVLTAFTILLQRYTGQHEIVIGSPMANRTRDELNGLIGCLMNMLVLRIDLSNNPPFREALSRIRSTTLDAYAHQDVPFEKLVEILQPERDLSRTPFFQVAFDYRNDAIFDLDLPGLTVQGKDVHTRTTKFDLTLIVEEQQHGLRATIQYNTDLFDGATISRMLGHLETLLENIAQHPDRRVGDLSLLTAAELQQLATWNDTTCAYPEDSCLHHLFEAQVERSPDAVAAVFRDTHLTFQELNRHANRLAHYLRTRGVGPEIVVGICMEGSLELAIAIMGVLKAGGIYLPLDPGYPTDRLAFMLEDANVDLVLTQHHLEASIADIAKDVLSLDTAEALLREQSDTNPPHDSTAENMSYIIYTSGSTGRPKGVMIQHRAVINLLQHTRGLLSIDSSSRILQFSSFSFDVSVREVFEPLLTGGTLYLERREAMMPGEPLLRLLKQSAITMVTLAPSVWEHLPEADLPALKTAIAGGEACPAAIVNRWAPGRMFVNAYGPTEITVASSMAVCTAGGGKPTIGRPFSNTQYYVVDQHMQLCPIGVAGELLIGGAGLARGYLGRPALTAERFIPNPFSTEPGTRLYRSGDLARFLPNGEVDYLGRIDTQVKIRGFRIELGEIETVLMEHEAISAATVTCHVGASEDKQLVAYVVADTEGSRVTAAELKTFLGEKLPRYMVPQSIIFLEAIPLTPAGKVDVRALPSPENVRDQRAYVAPRSPIEQVIIEEWTTILKVDQISVHDNFFELGGHSLLATQVCTWIYDTFGVEIPILRLFEAPTVAELAQSLVSDPQEGPRVQHIAELIVHVAELDDDEIARLLEEMPDVDTTS
jgi:amino acid adenylation domain-containing protein